MIGVLTAAVWLANAGAFAGEVVPPEPAFEEMAAPETDGLAHPGLTPLSLAPRHTDAGPAPLAVSRPSARAVADQYAPATSFKVAPRTAPAPIAASVPQAVAPPLVAARPSETSSAPLGGRLVQIGAYRSRSEAEKALTDWRRDATGSFAGIAAPSIVTAELGEKGIFYRIRIAGFGNSRKAGDFCAAYKGPGRDCFIVP